MITGTYVKKTRYKKRYIKNCVNIDQAQTVANRAVYLIKQKRDINPH